MNIPVYVFAGFLDSGKSTFLQDSLRDPQFYHDEKTLLLLCEDGEVEYDEHVLSQYQANCVWIEKESDLTFAFLQECQNKYHPDRIMVEFNGMWNLTSFLEMELPIEWIFVQILTTVDARSFEMYINNMRSLLYDQLVHSSLIVCNRCDEKTKKSFLRGNIKAINKDAQIVYENINGEVNTLSDDELPFDIKKGHIEIQDDDYGLWYMDALEHPEKYAGKTVTLSGMVGNRDYEQGMYLIGRQAMVCCEDDVSMIGFIVRSQDVLQVKEESWIKLTARISVEYDENYEGDVPIMNEISHEDCASLAQDYVTFS